MTLEEQLAPLRDLDADALSLADCRAAIVRLLACVETCVTVIRDDQAEIHRLRTEVAHLKGEHGPLQRPGPGQRPGPDRRPGAPAPGVAPASPTSYSSERQRRDRPARSARTRKKRRTTPETPPARTETLSVPNETLPPDAVFKGIPGGTARTSASASSNSASSGRNSTRPATGKPISLPCLREALRKEVEDAALLSAYRAQREWPVVRCLVGDDAAVLRGLTEELALCWIHDGRHYARLIPEFRLHRGQLDQFLDAYWGLYRELKAYREAPAEAQRLEAAFDRLVSRGKLNWSDLLRCMERTRANKAKLLLVLKHPELRLHNNEAELGARKRVRKRDVSFGPRSAAGVRAWDTFQSLAETARKQGVRCWEYLVDRFTGAGEIPRLADLITARARLLDLGASWAAT